ncbi:hypothetical protein [Acidisphaera sp. S103]|uniref:hypothetical protein n=1 Tax=Acidisphaera sp. S103 TaxID=1747223 RepID=UPI00131B2C5A|nr:hypothetical protein [Acidisphaera sp. S103]
MDADPNTASALSDGELVLRFESIGDNCELGLVQRRAGAEPLGLLRFAGVPLRNLVRGLNARFANIADPSHIRINVEHDEYMVKLTKYDFTFHAQVKAGEIAPEVLHQQQVRTIGFLAGKLIADLETPAKILVFRQNEPLLAGDLIDLRVALAAYGPNVLLWVREACPGHPPGSVVVADERMMVGYVRRLAERDSVPDLDFGSWMRMLRRAHAIWLRASGGRLVSGAAEPPARTELAFGIEGNAGPNLGVGWSGPEAGYQWTVGERSVLIVDVPGEADEYWLEMDVAPYIKPPLLPRQRLDVLIGGTLVHSFVALPRGEVGCVVPGRLVTGRKQIEIMLDHPNAASPMLVAGDKDDRRLGVSFHRIALVCA